jgi:hypothetical protein
MSKQHCAAESQKQNYADECIRREKRSVKPAQIIGPHQGVLIDQQRASDNNSYDRQHTQVCQKV